MELKIHGPFALMPLTHVLDEGAQVTREERIRDALAGPDEQHGLRLV
jgi:hypothetical protein